MSETLLVAVVGGVCSIGGAALGLIASTTKNQLEAHRLAAGFGVAYNPLRMAGK